MKVTELRVTEIFENSYAESLGIKVDDILLFCNGVELLSIEQLIDIIESNSGNPVSYSIKRGDSEFVVKAKALNLGLMINTHPVVKQSQESNLFDNENSTSDSSTSVKSTSVEKNLEYSVLSLLLFFLASLSLLGGLVLCVQLWPGDPGYGNQWKTIAFIPAITSLSAGVVQLALFAALGQGLHYLKQIASNK